MVLAIRHLNDYGSSSGKWADKSAKHINHSYKLANQSNICNMHLSEAINL